MIKSVLLADDSPTIRRVVELMFADSGLRLETVATGVEALVRLDTLRPDLVLADVQMPEPGGYELCRRVKRSPRPVPVLLLAGAFEGFDPEQMRACGADGYLTKPFDTRALVQRVHDLLSPSDTRRSTAGAASAPPAQACGFTPGEPRDADGARAVEFPVETIEAIARAVAERLVGPLAAELARELAVRGAESKDLA